jgi:hypothetical protein
VVDIKTEISRSFFNAHQKAACKQGLVFLEKFMRSFSELNSVNPELVKVMAESDKFKAIFLDKTDGESLLGRLKDR